MSHGDLLPLQPIPPDTEQHALSADRLPDLNLLGTYLGRLRAAADRELALRFPHFGGKPYPLGRCREIRDAVYDRLVADIHKPGCAVSGALLSFFNAGGIGRKIWGVLRESYFQNALQLGTWYVDVANDTVDPSKPQIEILPLDRSGMVAVRDYFHFAQIARSYWDCEVYANTALPGLAAMFPILYMTHKGAISLAAASDQMIALTRSRGFEPSLTYLKTAEVAPVDVRRRLGETLRRHEKLRMLATGDSVAAVEDAIRQRRFEDQGFYERCVAGYRAIG